MLKFYFSFIIKIIIKYDKLKLLYINFKLTF